MDFRRLVDDLIHRQSEEVAEHDVDDGTHTRHGAPTPRPVMPGFGDGRVEDAFGAKFLNQAGEHFKWRASFGHIFTHDEDAWVAAHLFGQCLADGLRQRDFAHRPCWCSGLLPR